MIHQRHFCTLLLILAGHVLISACSNSQVPAKPSTPDKEDVDYSGQKRPFAIGHRGMFKTYPENTLAAIEACVAGGMGAEFDVRTSKDGELVIIHDDNVARTTNGGAAKVADLTLAELKQLDAGSWFGPSFAGQQVPTFEETLILVKEKQQGAVPLAVNIKGVDQAGEVKLVALLKKYDLLAQSFCFDQSEQASKRLKQLDPKVKIGKNVGRSNLQAELAEGIVDVFLIGFVPTEAEVERLRAANKQLVVNIGGSRENDNLPSAWKDFLVSGVDGILVDYVAEFNTYIDNLFKPKDPA